MTTETADHLASLGVTVKDARDFVMSHLDDLGTVAEAAHQHGITADELAQIVGGDITGLQVAAIMAAHGIEMSGHEMIPALADTPQDVASVVGVAHQNDHAVG